MQLDDSIYHLIPIVDLNTVFRSTPDALVVNRIFDFSNKSYPDDINNVVYSKGSDVTFTATCSPDCGNFEGNYYIGMVCPKCMTQVKNPLIASEGVLPNRVWLGVHRTIKGILNPAVYMVLSRWLKYKTTNYIDIITNPDMPLPPELEGVVLDRGFNYFYDNFDSLMDYFCETIKRPSAKQAKENAKFIRRFIFKYRNCMFTQYLPALNSALHPITTTTSDTTSTKSRKYGDKNSQFFLKAAHTLSRLEFYPKRFIKQDDVDITTFKAYQAYITYHANNIKKLLTKKPSIVRKHIFGSRLHWVFRSVIRPITGPHRYDELYLPWGVAVNLLRVHIVSKLTNKYGYAEYEALAKQQKAIIANDDLIRQIIYELIDESPFPGLPILFNRNPSLRRGSSQLLFFTRVHDDINDFAIGFSSLLTAGPNADYDGDEMNGLLIIETDAAKIYEIMHPRNNFFSADGPSVGTIHALETQTYITLNRFLGRV